MELFNQGEKKGKLNHSGFFSELENQSAQHL